MYEWQDLQNIWELWNYTEKKKKEKKKKRERERERKKKLRSDQFTNNNSQNIWRRIYSVMQNDKINLGFTTGLKISLD